VGALTRWGEGKREKKKRKKEKRRGKKELRFGTRARSSPLRANG